MVRAADGERGGSKGLQDLQDLLPTSKRLEKSCEQRTAGGGTNLDRGCPVRRHNGVTLSGACVLCHASRGRATPQPAEGKADVPHQGFAAAGK
jgi:hypothetical protein